MVRAWLCAPTSAQKCCSPPWGSTPHCQAALSPTCRDCHPLTGDLPVPKEKCLFPLWQFKYCFCYHRKRKLYNSRHTSIPRASPSLQPALQPLPRSLRGDQASRVHLVPGLPAVSMAPDPGTVSKACCAIHQETGPRASSHIQPSGKMTCVTAGAQAS